ncbi:MAG: ABC transporter ATP-binding protein [Simkaniaceae bacterium]|nr:ABC transporter ATP-binding protein [Simkaniaceae bacterium]
MTPLKITHFEKKYGKFVAVDDVSFAIKPGEVFGFLGPNGAGKTTIISSIVTLQAPTKGSIEVFGIDVRKNPDLAKSFIGFVPQELIHYGFFSVEEILKFHANYYGMKVDKDHLRYLLEKLHLWHHRKKLVNQLSGGMKRRLLIVKALIHQPKILLLDEPTAGVDSELRASLWDFIQELKENAMSILLTTHYLEEAERLCDRIGILNHGRLQRVDSTEKLLKEHSSKKITLILSKPAPPITHPRLIRQSDHDVNFNIPNEMPLNLLFKEAKIPLENIQDITIKVGTLEDVMHNLLNEKA